MNFKNIHIGSIILKQVQLQNISTKRICNFFKCSEDEIEDFYEQKSLDTDMLLKWSKLLKHNLFLYYQNHLILYAPSAASIAKKEASKNDDTQHLFRKNIYTKEIKDYMVELILKKEKTQAEVVKKYHIPKNTLLRWLKKNQTQEVDEIIEKKVVKKKHNPITSQYSRISL